MSSSTALNRTSVAMLTNKSGGNLVYGDVVVLDNTNANGFTTTTTAGLSTRGIGVIIDIAGIANNATGRVAVAGWVPQVNLNAAATIGQFLKTFTVAGQATPHSSPQVEGDFAVTLGSGTSPAAVLFGSANGPTGSLADGDYGDITVSGGGTAMAIDLLAVTYAKMQNISAASRVLGRGSAAGAGSPQELTLGGGLTMSGTVLNSRVVQVVHTQTGAAATGTTQIPFDDTIPQITEGDEYMTLAITPTDAANILIIEVQTFATSTTTPWISVALFQDATADALAATSRFTTTATAGGDSTLVHRMVAGTTSATTFRVRIGPSNAATVTFNGASGSRIFGGVMASSITITEYLP